MLQSLSLVCESEFFLVSLPYPVFYRTQEMRNSSYRYRRNRIIALIDQFDNSITIHVIQIVLNFPGRYLYFPICISFHSIAIVSNLEARYFSFFLSFLPPCSDFFFSSTSFTNLETAVLRIYISLNVIFIPNVN